MQLVAQVVLIWNNPDDLEGKASLEQLFADHSKVTVLGASRNSLNNRYDRKFMNVTTEAVMIVDDDIAITLDTISCVYQSWSADKSKIHSFGEPRGVSSQSYTVLPEKYTNFLLTRMLVLTKYLDVYFEESYAQVRHFVDTQEAHCDDIAFALIVTKHSNAPLVSVPAPHGWRRDGGFIEWVNIRSDNSVLYPPTKEQLLADLPSLTKGGSGNDTIDHRLQTRLECSKALILC
jgi:hypothetical protein